ncbi:unnamed protein product [Arabidopsis thaliana]|uniref:Uncharacterized protein n=1 Tax=Arabidopsis thaliana TaxID=3702 RepID=A0A654F6V7_ARATH|nr:unnamed protein product [Arabidopsis thaliana]
MGSRGNRVGERWNEMDCDEKSSVIQEEIKRVCKLPSNSVYAVHRLKVLNKINDLLSVQRTLSQEKELELLFTQLSFLWDEFPLGRNIFPDSDTRMMKTHKSLKLEVNGTFREEVRRPLIVRNGVVYWSCIQRSYVLKCERWEQSKLSYKRGMGGIVLGANVGEGL